jgi:hypothetical protein
MVGKERPVALFSPSVRSIKLYRDGRIEYLGTSGSVVGATARVEASGSRRTFLDDTRKVVLRIDGPRVTIAAPLPVNGFHAHDQAREFAEIVNDLAMQLAGSTRAPSAPPPPPPPWEPDLLDRLERLGRLRDSGVLTEDEFQAQKAALVRPTHDR